MKIIDFKITTLAMGIAMTTSVLADQTISDTELAEQATFSNKALIDGSAGVGGTSIRYKSFAASGMKALSQSFDYRYSGGGCMQAVAPTTYAGFDDMLDLPVDSKLVSMTLLTNPTSSSDIQTAIIYQSLNGTFSTIGSVTVNDSGISNFTSEGIFLDHTLLYDGLTMARLEISGNDAEICGLRVGYVGPDVASDVLFVSNFYK